MSDKQDDGSWIGKEFRETVGFVLTTVTAVVALGGAFLWGTGKIQQAKAAQELENLYLGKSSMPSMDTTIPANRRYCSEVPESKGRYNYKGIYSAKNQGEVAFHVTEVTFRIHKIPVVTTEDHQGEAVVWYSLNSVLAGDSMLLAEATQSVPVDETFYANNTMEVAFGFDLTQDDNHNYVLEVLASGGLPEIDPEDEFALQPENKPVKEGEDVQPDVQYRMRFGARDMRMTIPLNCKTGSHWAEQDLAAYAY